MKKIIAAFDGLKYSESTAAYAAHLASKYNGKVFGVFLEDFTYHSYKIADLIGQDYVEEERASVLNKRDSDVRESSIRNFNATCEEAGIVYSIHRDRNIAIRELLHESKYGDIIVIQNNETLTHYSEETPTNFISTLLESTACPVIIVPPHYRQPDKIVLLYDGEPASLYAIKQFGYLFRDNNTAVELVCVKNKKEDKVIPEGALLREWVKLHFPQTTYHVLIGEPQQEIINYLKEQVQNPLVVLGAYSRGSISRLMHHSLADTIMQSVDIPMFISHK
jgi:hypothetical protein